MCVLVPLELIIVKLNKNLFELSLHWLCSFSFEFGACTIDPQTEAYDPSPLIDYMKTLGDCSFLPTSLFFSLSSFSLLSPL